MMKRLCRQHWLRRARPLCFKRSRSALVGDDDAVGDDALGDDAIADGTPDAVGTEEDAAGVYHAEAASEFAHAMLIDSKAHLTSAWAVRFT